MGEERKSVMVSGRLPAVLVERLDYVTRNTDTGPTINRTGALRASLEKWLPEQERQIQERLGGAAKKVR